MRCAVVSGLGNTRKLLDRILAGKIHYDFVEVMACPGGCVGGGGQPIDKEDRELGGIRGDRLHQLDGQGPLRFSHENPQVQALYREFWANPSARSPSTCSTVTILLGPCPTSGKPNNFLLKNSAS